MPQAIGSRSSRRIPGGSLLAVQFEKFRIASFRKGQNKNSSYRLIANGDNLNSTWFTNRPRRLTGGFYFDDITGRDNWRGLFLRDNPNSSLSSNGRTIVFETGFFKKRANGSYVSRIRPNATYRDDITGSWTKASLVVDSTQSELDMDNYFDNTAGGSDTLAIITGGYPDVTSGCSTAGVGYNPIIITNTTDQAQYVNFTVNSQLANNIYITGASVIDDIIMDGSASYPCGGGYGSNYGTSQLLTIPAGQTWVGGMISGGVDGADTGLNTIAAHNLAVGGGVNSGHWYDLDFNVMGIYNKYLYWDLVYNKTGGVQNSNQNGFVVVQANPQSGTAGTQFTITNTVLSPYSSTNTNPLAWYNNDAMAFAFL